MGNSLTNPPDDRSETDLRLATRLSALRQEHGWSLDGLAERSGISRATLSRIERGDTSPSASLLGRLCAAYGRTMSRLLAEVEADPPRLLTAADQPVWTDPETGFRRHSVSPPARGFNGELLAAELPPGTDITYAAVAVPGLEHHLWMQSGVLDLTVDGTTYRLRPGDCLRFRLFGPNRFQCPGPESARYVIAIIQP